jgi:transcriptional regulator with XRE-family HTH domain
MNGMSEVRDAIDQSASRQDDLASLGRVLREERERQGMTCQAFAESLHMGQEQLAALENGDRDNLPEPVFIRGMLRRVAQKLGLDPVPLVQQFQSQLRETKEAPPAKRVSRERSGFADAAPDNQDSAPIGRWIRNAAIPFLLIGVAAFSAIAFRSNRQQPAGVSTVTSQDQPVPQPTPPLDNNSVIDVAVDGDNKISGSILLLSSQPSWVSVRNRSREVIFEGILNNSKRFEGDQGIEVFAGRPDLVRFSYADASPRALGSIDQLRWYPLTPEP